jgi:hypothetical protein
MGLERSECGMADNGGIPGVDETWSVPTSGTANSDGENDRVVFLLERGHCGRKWFAVALCSITVRRRRIARVRFRIPPRTFDGVYLARARFDFRPPVSLRPQLMRKMSQNSRGPTVARRKQQQRLVGGATPPLADVRPMAVNRTASFSNGASLAAKIVPPRCVHR